MRLREHPYVCFAMRRAEQLVIPPPRPALCDLADNRSLQRMGLRQPDAVDTPLEQPPHQGRRLIDISAHLRHDRGLRIADERRRAQTRSRSLREIAAYWHVGSLLGRSSRTRPYVGQELASSPWKRVSRERGWTSIRPNASSRS